MISPETGKIIQKKQKELDGAIYQQAQVDGEGRSLINAKRLKLNILVEIGEFANELKTFKIWRKKKEMNLAKAKEELIDCLCFFLGLGDVYQIDFADYKLSGLPSKELDFNNLLLQFFSQTEKLIVLENETSYSSKERTKLAKKENETYHHGLQIFSKMVQKLEMDEKELLSVYDKKMKTNQQRVSRGGH